MKKLIFSTFLCLAFLWCMFLIPTRTQASENRITSDADADKIAIITALTASDYDLNNLSTVEIIQNDNENIDPIYYAIMSLRTINAEIEYPDGTVASKRLNVKWNCLYKFDRENFIDPSILGDQTEYSRIVLPTDEYTYIFADGVPAQLELPVLITVPDSTMVITSVETYLPNPFPVIVINPGEDITKEINLWSNPIRYYESDGITYHGGYIDWDTTAIDVNTCGSYDIMGTFRLPMHCVFADDFIEPELKIILVVQEIGKPDIRYYYLNNIGLTIPWKVPTNELSYIKPFISENNGPWNEIIKYETTIHWNENELLIDYNALNKGSSYQLQVEYKDGQTGILCFTYDEAIMVTDYMEGDRDGGDTNGNSSIIGGGKPTLPPEISTPDPSESETSAPDSNESEASAQDPDEPETSAQDPDEPETSAWAPIEPESSAQIPTEQETLATAPTEPQTSVPTPTVAETSTPTPNKPESSAPLTTESETFAALPGDQKTSTPVLNESETFASRSDETAKTDSETETSAPELTITDHLSTIVVVAVLIAVVSAFILFVSKRRD